MTSASVSSRTHIIADDRIIPLQDNMETPSRQPIFNIPTVVLLFGALMASIHLARSFLLTDRQDLEVLIWFAFIPARYVAGAEAVFPSSSLAEIWTFGTYALLHGDFTHLLVNLFWMAAFGTALARRFESLRFLLFSLICAVAGVALHLVFYWGEMVPVVGASAAISGHMAAIARFGFSPGGPMSRSIRLSGQAGWTVPALSIVETLKHRSALIFLGVWFAVNFIFGISGGSLMGEDTRIAWQAHVGGFLAGLLLFDFFDPIKTHRDDSWENNDFSEH